jgi:sporulation protein YlmC with PRC-barrel domain
MPLSAGLSGAAAFGGLMIALFVAKSTRSATSGAAVSREGGFMRSARALVLGFVVMIGLAGVQTAFAGGKETRGDSRGAGEVIRQHPGGLIQGDWLKRRAIKDEQGRELGKIEEVWLDPKDGRVKEVVVSVGGFLGIGEKHRILPWQDVQVTWENQDLVVRVSEPALRRARLAEESQREAGDGGRQPAASPGSRPAPR